MEPMFYQGQKIVCVDSSGRTTWDRPSPIIEGKTYTVSNPNAFCPSGRFIAIELVGFDNIVFRQTRFVPLDFNDYAEEEIFESLKGVKIEK